VTACVAAGTCACSFGPWKLECHLSSPQCFKVLALRHGGGDISHRCRKRSKNCSAGSIAVRGKPQHDWQPTTNCPRQCAVGRLGNAPVSKILDPDSDQVAKMSCAFRKTVQRVTGDEFDGKSFRLADEVRHIQRRAARHDGRVVTIGQLVLFSTENRRCLAARPFRSARRAVCG
jgi:hypothetical protein